MDALQKLTTRSAVLALMILAISVKADDSVYPAGSSITSRYTLSDTVVDYPEMVTISRTIVNNESFPLTGLYLSDNLPPGLSAIGYSIQINGSSTGSAFFDANPNEIINGCNSYYWVVDDPANASGIHDTLYPGDSLVCQLSIAPDSAGLYQLPLHTAVFYGNSTSYFATDDTVTLRVQASLDVHDNPDDASLLPVSFISSRGYPNPFNASVNIQYEAENLVGRELTLVIRNLLGQEIRRQTVNVVSHTGELVWEPRVEVSSGIYFYTLESGGARQSGKLVLVK